LQLDRIRTFSDLTVIGFEPGFGWFWRAASAARARAPNPRCARSLLDFPRHLSITHSACSTLLYIGLAPFAC
jgi:hypothetical protein